MPLKSSSSPSSTELLRISDFCRPEGYRFSSSLLSSEPGNHHHRRRRRGRGRRDHEYPLSVTIQETTIDRRRRSTSSLDTSWTSTTTTTTTASQCCAVGWVSASILMELSQREGEYACLSLGPKKILLRLYLTNDENDEPTDIEYDDSKDGYDTDRRKLPGDNQDTGSGDHDDKRVILVPPVTLCNLLGHLRNSHKGTKHVGALESMIYTLPVPAHTILLRPLARPPHWPRLLTKSSSSSSSSSSPSADHEDDTDKTSLDICPYPPIDTLIEKSQILAVYETNPRLNAEDGSTKDIMTAQSNNNSSPMSCYYYHVMDVTTKPTTAARTDGSTSYDDETNPPFPSQDTSCCFYVITKSTLIQWDQSSLLPQDYRIPRLPSFLAQQHYYFSSTAKQRQQEPEEDKEYEPPPHPDLASLTAILNLIDASSTMTPVNERIIHVVGNDLDHDLSWLVETASHHVGRTCWSLQGLSAYAHATGHRVRSGSLIDQLVGLESAFDEIEQRRMQPCVFHLQQMDTELSNVTHDDGTFRREQEQRIWSTILKALSRTMEEDNDFHPPAPCEASRTSTIFGTDDSYDRSVCPLIVIVSTSKPLKAGPWLENLVFPSIRLSLPDDTYIRHLWKDMAPWDETHLDPLSVLRGRGCREIRSLLKEVQRRQVELSPPSSHPHEEEEAVHHVVQNICQRYDDRRRKQRSAAVAQIRWEDVGGLAHVRDEIMDVIGLPLKYPHLFPGGKGRTGILLYGPPGTGKTLVAKAVATECGIPFLSVKGPELLGSYVGESEANVRAVFQSAREAAEENLPIMAAILFFDELDSLAPKRGGVGDGGGVMERVVATLLTELDVDLSSSTKSSPPSSSPRVFVMGATNRPDLLDPSLLRPGRLDRCVYLGITEDEDERALILAAQLRKLKLDGQISPLEMSRTVVSMLPPRLTGADFSTIASGALLLALERLCRSADEQRTLASSEQGREVELSEILEEWDAEKCTPTIVLNDILKAAESVVPSVSKEELNRYELLRDQYSAEAPTAAIEHDGDMFYQAEVQ